MAILCQEASRDFIVQQTVNKAFQEAGTKLEVRYTLFY